MVSTPPPAAPVPVLVLQVFAAPVTNGTAFVTPVESEVFERLQEWERHALLSQLANVLAGLRGGGNALAENTNDPDVIERGAKLLDEAAKYARASAVFWRDAQPPKGDD